jgi:hypothetical protein
VVRSPGHAAAPGPGRTAGGGAAASTARALTAPAGEASTTPAVVAQDGRNHLVHPGLPLSAPVSRRRR